MADYWYAPDDPTPREQCPCCDYITLPERATYLICPICYWEDDGLDVDELDVVSGANNMTLRQARSNFKKEGASANERSQYQYRPRDKD